MLQGRSFLVSLPPLPENGPDDESKIVEEEGDDEDIPSALSSNEEVEDDDEEEAPARKKLKRRSGGDSATASSPTKDAGVDMDEAGMSLSGTHHDWDEALVVPPVSSAPPRAFARMPSLSVGSDDDLETTR